MSNHNKINLSVIIPVYNEEKVVGQTIQGLKKELGRLDLEYEIIAVNDGSTDKTKEILEKIDEIKVIGHHKNMGYGTSLKTGIKESKYEHILIIDADGSYPVEAVKEITKYIPEYDMVIGARRKYRPFYGRPAKWFLNKLASYLVEDRVPDLNSGMRIFKKQIVLDNWHFFPEKFSFSSTLTMVCLTNKHKVRNVEIDYLKRRGRSKLKPIKSFKQFTELVIRLALHFNPLKVFVPLSFVLFLASVLVFFYSWLFAPKILDVTVALLIISSIQVLILGMLADLIVKTKK